MSMTSFLSLLFLCTLVRFILYFIYSYKHTNLGAKIFSIIIDYVTIIVTQSIIVLYYMYMYFMMVPKS